MMVRPITKEEVPRAKYIGAVAFRGSQDLATWTQERLLWGYETYRACFDEDGAMTAVMRSIPHEMNIDGTFLKSGGIASVASLPESRGQGNIRAIFQYVLRELYEGGAALSYLYPFSFAYYRQFGYELCCTNTQFVDMPIDNLLPGKSARRITQLMPGESDAPLREVYARFAGRYNLMLRRTDVQWQRFLQFDPVKDNRYVYCVHGTGGLCGYAVISAPPAQGEQKLQIIDCAFDDVHALRSVLSLVRSLGAQVDKMSMRIPEDVPYDALIADPHRAGLQCRAQGMGRVVNAALAISALAAPQAPGEGVLAVRDAQLPQNDGAFLLTWGGGKVHRVERTNRTPDASLPVGRLAQLVCGFRSMQDMRYFPDVDAPGLQKLAPLFPRRPVNLSDFF